jgi:anti-sigma regulatory factor (Ser/Thr protein kinase)
MAEAFTRVRFEPGNRTRRPHSWSVTLTGERRDAKLARTHARQALGPIDADTAQDVLLVVSELVTNAVVHGRDPILLTLTIEPSEVTVSVTDRGSSQPRPRQPDEEDEDGRGLEIIQQLSKRWHVERHNGTKSVIAVLRSAPDAD